MVSILSIMGNGNPPHNEIQERLREEICGSATDAFLELLLNGMSFFLQVDEDYRQNIAGFKGKYIFRTKNGRVQATAIYQDDKMTVVPQAEEGVDWDVRITFSKAEAFKNYILSGGMDTLTPLLTGEVENEGNNNYIYKYGFMARDLARRMGVLDLLI